MKPKLFYLLASLIIGVSIFASLAPRTEGQAYANRVQGMVATGSSASSVRPLIMGGVDAAGDAQPAEIDANGLVKIGVYTVFDPDNDGFLGYGEARSTKPTVASDGNPAAISVDVEGRLRLGRPSYGAPTIAQSALAGYSSAAAGNITAGGSGGAVIAAPSAGNHLRIHSIELSNTGSTTVNIWLREGAAGTQYHHTPLPQSVLIPRSFPGGWDLATATALVLYSDVTGGTIHYTVRYEVVAD